MLGVTVCIDFAVKYVSKWIDKFYYAICKVQSRPFLSEYKNYEKTRLSAC